MSPTIQTGTKRFRRHLFLMFIFFFLRYVFIIWKHLTFNNATVQVSFIKMFACLVSVFILGLLQDRPTSHAATWKLHSIYHSPLHFGVIYYDWLTDTITFKIKLLFQCFLLLCTNEQFNTQHRDIKKETN